MGKGWGCMGGGEGIQDDKTSGLVLVHMVCVLGKGGGVWRNERIGGWAIQNVCMCVVCVHACVGV